MTGVRHYRFVRLSFDRRTLHYGDFEEKPQDFSPAIERLSGKLELSRIRQVRMDARDSHVVLLTLLASDNTEILALVSDAPEDATVWYEALLSLCKLNVDEPLRSKEVQETLTILDVAVRLAYLTNEGVLAPPPDTPSVEGMPTNFFYDIATA